MNRTAKLPDLSHSRPQEWWNSVKHFPRRNNCQKYLNNPADTYAVVINTYGTQGLIVYWEARHDNLGRSCVSGQPKAPFAFLWWWWMLQNVPYLSQICHVFVRVKVKSWFCLQYMSTKSITSIWKDVPHCPVPSWIQTVWWPGECQGMSLSLHFPVHTIQEDNKEILFWITGLPKYSFSDWHYWRPLFFFNFASYNSQVKRKK